jgi:hypothetical protein
MWITRGLGALLGLGIIAQANFPSTVLAGNVGERPLQIYGLTLDETRLGTGFCERREEGAPIRRSCVTSPQSLPKLINIDVQTTPAPHVRLTLTPDSTGHERDVRIWYAPREKGGQSFMISTRSYHALDLESVRGAILERFGPPTIEFSHADMEARGIEVANLTIDTLLYVDRTLADAQRARIARRLRTEFDPTGVELFSLTNTRLRTLARLLGPDFRGAIVQISESPRTNRSAVSTILLDLPRAQSIFRLDG